ncbi:hypothetical protein PC9H_001231 [Pleurotus ostreatus]|uniref:Uncharacterized protein n=1 Tax=Pleurotus ostreatus TaxID=5322 RepID=A0A8H7A686_PLEOS|nr:uncharacterized protein PC9H_001231 [Pleurotus ostreatus]KAF7440882.1 hypothetical protein PC9H_001231 [Pleurotus ostreatus]
MITARPAVTFGSWDDGKEIHVYVFSNINKEKIEAAQIPLWKAIVAAAARALNLPADVAFTF